MKTMLKTTLAFALPLLLAAAAGAQTGPAATNRIATVDLKKVFDRYYKLDQTRKAFEKEEADMEKDLKNMATDVAKAQDEYKRLHDAEDDAMISDKEKAARKAKADAKQDEVKSYQADLANYEQQAKEKLSLDQQHMMDLLMQDIQTAINAKAKAAGFFMVVDTSARVANGANSTVVLYSSGENDLTDEIIKQLNAAAPPPSSDAGSGTNSVKADSLQK
jgi:Skp family chaperone for outer membrane proteins